MSNLVLTRKEAFEFARDVFEGKMELSEVMPSVKKDIAIIMQNQITILSKPKTATKTQKANEELKASILDHMRTMGSVRIMDLVTAYENQYSSSKISALVTQLKNEDKVVRTEDKSGKVYFRIAE